MTHSDRKLCQDYTVLAKPIVAKELRRKQIKENVKAVLALIVIFVLFCVAGSMTYPY